MRTHNGTHARNIGDSGDQMPDVQEEDEKDNLAEFLPTEGKRLVQDRLPEIRRHRLHQKIGGERIPGFDRVPEIRYRRCQKIRGESVIKFGGVITVSLAALLCVAQGAFAIKPSAPVSITCATVSSSGRVYRAECDVQSIAEPPPESARMEPLSDPTVAVTESISPGPRGMGKWIIVLDFKEQKAVNIPFEINYPGGMKMRVGAIYDPFQASKNKTEPLMGVVTDGKSGKVREFLSK
jgi:hypothetical protein